MVKKLSLFITLCSMLVLLTACAAGGNSITITSIPTIIPPTETQAPPPTPILPTETPTQVQPTSTPTTPPANPITHYPNGQEFTVTSIHMVDADNGWAIGSLGAQTGDHVLSTTDGGNTWKEVTPPQDQPESVPHETAIGFFLDAKTAWVTYAIGGGTPVPTNPVVWRTTDGGTSWTASPALDVSNLAQIYIPSTMQFIGDSGWILVHVGVGMNHDYVVLYRSSDGGVSWKRIIDPYIDGGIQSCTKTSMLFTDATHGWLTGDCNGVKAGVLLFSTSDAGSTWKEVTLPAPAATPDLFTNMNVSCGSYDPFFFGNDVGHMSIRCANFEASQITYSYYIYTTQDSGNTWTGLSYPGNALYFVTKDIGWALANKIQLTTDGGKTWKPISDVTWTAQFDFIDQNTGWAIAQSGNEVALVKTDNGGVKWTILTPNVGP